MCLHGFTNGRSASNFATVPVYPRKVADILVRRANVDQVSVSATGRAASFACGCFVEIDLEIGGGVCRGGRFRTNGCGYMTASAATLIETLNEKKLRDLHGLDDHQLLASIETGLGSLIGRRQCAEVCITALHKSFEAYRAKTIAEYAGETALICTCFGIAENTIVDSIAANGLSTVEEVSAELMAGRGCGSCRGLIDEIIDAVGAQTM